MRHRGHLPGGPLLRRLSVFPVRVPSLRERKLDIPKLARSVIDELNQTYEHKKSLTPGAEALLLQYNWPGNVRELRNVMERAFIMSDGEQIQPPRPGHPGRQHPPRPSDHLPHLRRPLQHCDTASTCN